MNRLFHKKYIYIVGVVFLAIVMVTSLATGQLGRVLNLRFLPFAQEKPQEDVVLKERKVVKKITIEREEDNGGCIEVTPDGIVRVYSVCQETLETAAREDDPKYILRLFESVSKLDLSKYSTKPSSGPYITLTVESDSGTEVVYIPQNNPSNPPGITEIIEIIEIIVDDAPTPTPTTPPATGTPTPTESTTPTPSVTIDPFMSPTPTPISGPVLQPFTCDFVDIGGKKKPLNISNFICSSEPTPAP